jgi:hypothetical protein
MQLVLLPAHYEHWCPSDSAFQTKLSQNSQSCCRHCCTHCPITCTLTVSYCFCLAGAADAAPSNALAAAAAAAGQLRRGAAGSFSTSRAAQRAQLALETLNPTTAAQIAGHFPLSISATWSGGTPAGFAAGGAAGHREGLGSGEGSAGFSPAAAAEPLLGPTEPLPILGVHWLDADAVAIVCQQGFSSLLLVLGFGHSHVSKTPHSGADTNTQRRLRVQEQVEWMDQPVDRQWGLTGGLAAWGSDCHVSVVGAGPRMYLLGQQGGVFCGRLMPWSERLKTLQVGFNGWRG